MPTSPGLIYTYMLCDLRPICTTTKIKRFVPTRGDLKVTLLNRIDSRLHCTVILGVSCDK